MSAGKGESSLIVFLDRATLGERVRMGRPDHPHRWRDYPATRPEEVVDRLRGARVAVTNKVRIDAATLESLPDLRFIAIAATGTDIIDVAAAASRGVQVRSVPGYGSVSVAEHVMMLMLALARALAPHRQAVLDGSWTRSGGFCFRAAQVMDLRGLRLGLVGSGSIALEVARRAHAFEMDVVFAGRRGAIGGNGKLPFDEVLATSDVLSLHCPLVKDTHQLIDARAIGLMKPGAILINTARGQLIDEAALAAGLDSGRIGGAGLDVAIVEPPPEGSLILDLARRSNVIVTPHMAWTGDDTVQRLADRLVESIDRFLASETP
ncbi:NAD(P)-dependent oxidoreductase [Sphingosinicella sp. CPCC 101087]|uniref:NAD(P)-dependent oxidoreductase n=1 Tax=Sphingosinicella sp. CPCC 101087 TaxID=2497754 RepID=UPI00101D81DC|nr:NAD(P)-dependent oxidoreductase [Sphingosinicella sp. CPCC 101087]